MREKDRIQILSTKLLNHILQDIRVFELKPEHRRKVIKQLINMLYQELRDEG